MIDRLRFVVLDEDRPILLRVKMDLLAPFLILEANLVVIVGCRALAGTALGTGTGR